MNTLEPISAFQALLADAKTDFQRRLIVIHGERDWGRSQLVLLQDSLPGSESFSRCVWISDSQPEKCEAFTCSKARQLLGQEVDCLVYDAFAGLNPDALGVSVGALRGGGVLILLCPDLDQWSSFLDPDYRRLLVHPFVAEQLTHNFLQHLSNTILRASQALLIGPYGARFTEGVSKSPDTKPECTRVSESVNIDSFHWLTDDQRQAVKGIVNVVKGHRRRPLVITSDRGRGKTTALGVACVELIKQGVRKVLVTAPRLDAVQPLFQHAAEGLGIKIETQPILSHHDATVHFIAPDKLLRNLPKADVLFVDEAASIPTSMLEALVKHYSRVVFATTVHGYEGAGRGFAVRFKALLSVVAPQWRELVMSQPVRWAPNDPLEAWLFDALLLNSTISDTDLFGDIDLSQTEIIQLNRAALLEDESRLKEIFGLLVLAHYQTTPSDLRNLLDGPNIRVWVMLIEGRVVATALVADEGGFGAGLLDAVWKGERRFRGHLIPQTLSAHGGIANSPMMSYQRIIRIAVHPTLQRKGLGMKLLDCIIDKAVSQGVDMVGSSFGLTEDVLCFWQRSGMVPVRLGVTRDTCSGAHSALMLMSLNEKSDELLDVTRVRFLEHLPYQLGNLFQLLEPELVAGLMLGADDYEGVELDEQDWLDVYSFAQGYRVFEVCSASLWKLLCCCIGHLDVQQALGHKYCDLLIYSVLQSRPLPWVAKRLGYSGKKELLSAMREAVDIICQQRLRLHSQLVH